MKNKASRLLCCPICSLNNRSVHGKLSRDSIDTKREKLIILVSYIAPKRVKCMLRKRVFCSQGLESFRFFSSSMKCILLTSVLFELVSMTQNQTKTVPLG